MDDTPTTLLVAERDESTRAFLLDNLAADGYEPLGAQTEEETRLKLRNHGAALLLLGRLGEDHGALALVRAIRSGEAGGDPTLPVIVLGDKGEELELLRAFEAGCDHFLPRPFSYIELGARVRACIRRAGEWHVPRRLIVGALVVDRDARKALHPGRSCGSAGSSLTCSPTWPPNPRECSRSGSSCATSGGSARRATRARSTPTPAGCARSWRAGAHRT